MSTSIAASVGPRTSGPETLAHPHSPPPRQEEEVKKDSPSPAEAFLTPVVKVDNSTGLALLVVRDGATGEELDQYPSKKVVEEYQRAQGSTAPDHSTSPVPADSGASLAVNATVPPAPVAAPPVSPSTGDARTTTTTTGAVSGVSSAKN